MFFTITPNLGFALPAAVMEQGEVKDSWISNFSIAWGCYYLALALSPTGDTKAARSKTALSCYSYHSYCRKQMEKCTNFYYRMGQKDEQHQVAEQRCGFRE
jgi:hypothetical protein